MTGRVDAHLHFFRRGGTPHATDPVTGPVLDRDLGEAEVVADMAAARVDRAVLVQAANSVADAERLLAAAVDGALAAVVVGWVTPDDPRRATAELFHLLGRGPLRGVRHLPDGPADTWLRGPAARAIARLLAGHDLVLEVMPLAVEHLHDAADLAAAVPGLQVVVDHLASPHLAVSRPNAWSEAVDALAELPGAAVKLSVGMRELLAAGDVLEWAATTVLGVFGPSRCLAASNWPVCRLRYSYAGMWRTLDELLAPLPVAERDQVLAGTATRVYRV